VLLMKLSVAGEQSLVSFIGRAKGRMRYLSQVLLDLPDVALGETPVEGSQVIKIRHAVSDEPRRVVNVRVEVTPCEMAYAMKDGAASMQSRIARARDGTPQPVLPLNENDVVQLVLRF
jgi:hypothetical protein